MNGYIIETRQDDDTARSGQRATQWIGIARSAREMISLLPGQSPSVVDRGPGVLARARFLGVQDGQFQEFHG